MKLTKDIEAKFSKLGISSWSELALIIPHSYEDFRLHERLQIHMPQLIDATVESVYRTPNSIQITFFAHNFGHTITGVLFRPKPYMMHQFQVGSRECYYGMCECKMGNCSMSMPRKITRVGAITPKYKSNLRNDVMGRFVSKNLTFEKYIASLDDHNLNLPVLIENESNDAKTEEADEIKTNRIFNIGFIALIVAILVTSISGTIYSPFVSAYLIENLLTGLTEAVIPIVVMIVYFPAQVLSQLFVPKVGKLLDRISPTKSTVILNLIKVLLIFLLVFTFTPYDFAVILIFLYLVLESNSYFIQAIVSRISIKHRGKMFGITTTFDSLGMIVGPILGGLVWDALNSTAPFIITIMIEWFLIPFFIIGIWILNPRVVEALEEKKN